MVSFHRRLVLASFELHIKITACLKSSLESRRYFPLFPLSFSFSVVQERKLSCALAPEWCVCVSRVWRSSPMIVFPFLLQRSPSIREKQKLAGKNEMWISSSNMCTRQHLLPFMLEIAFFLWQGVKIKGTQSFRLVSSLILLLLFN